MGSSGVATVESSEGVLDLVGKDPAAAVAAADALLDALGRPRTGDDLRAASTCHRAAGLALRDIGHADEGERRLRRAVSLADRSGHDDTAAQARMSLAYVLIERGSMRAALAAIDHASGLAAGRTSAQVRVMRALVLQRWGRTHESLAEYRDAERELARHPDPAWEARLRNNRALLLAYEGSTEAAMSDLRRARDLYLGSGKALDAVLALWNLGWVLGMTGEIAAALTLFDQAESELVARGLDAVEAPERWSDRAEVLLRAGLAGDAAASAARAVSAMSRLGWSAGEAEARLLLALCRLTLGEGDLGCGEASLARAAFVRQDRPAWAALGEYVALRADLSEAAAPAVLDRASRTASALRDLGWEGPAADLRVTAGRRALAAGDLARARTVLGPLAARSRVARLDVRSRAWFARALLDEAAGEQRQADSALRRAWAVVEDQRLLLGAAELRAGTASQAADLVESGLRLALSAGSATSCFDWAERGRAAVLRYRPVTSPDHPDLARALTRLRWTVRADEDARLDGQPDARLAAERRAQEQEVIRLARAQPGSLRTSAPVRAADVVAALSDDDVFVQLFVAGDDVHAVVLAARSRRLHRVCSARDLVPVLDRLHFAMRRELVGFGTERGLRASSAAIPRAAAALDELLVGPLRGALGERSLSVCPSGPLVGVPWSLLPTCRGRAVHVTPSATLWLSARRRRAEGAGGLDRVLAVAGPGLPGAEREVAEVVRLHPAARSMVGDGASVAAVLDEVAACEVVHLAAHGRLRRDNPLFTSLELADGPLTVFELDRLRASPRDVLLPACSAGAGQVLVADEALGLAWCLLAAGCAGVVAPLMPVPDDATHRLMADVHRRLAAGAALGPALAGAQQQVDGGAGALAGAFVAFGA